MRTNDPRVITSIRSLGYLSAAGAIGVALAACSSSTHLDPPGAGATGSGGAGTSATSTTGGGGGGGAPMACRSNPDCETYPQSICDTVKSACVQCLVDSDCAQKGGPACFDGVCGCPTKGDLFCAIGAGPAKQCVDKATSQTDCGSCGHACFGACADGKCADPWEPTSLVGAPEARTRHVAVWDATHSKMVVWGGRAAGGVTATGGVYDLATNTWTPTSMANAPSARVDATAVWDDVGSRMIVWGGHTAVGGGTPLGSGATYDPAKNVWKTIANDGSMPSPRWGHTAVWAGANAKMIIWGGTDGVTAAVNGASYDPATGKWEMIGPFGGGGRYDHSAVWAGNSMFVWGGYGSDDGVMPDAHLASGASYDPVLKTWSTFVASGPPTARSQATAVWNGTTTVTVWGGSDGAAFPGVGATYSGTIWSATTPGPAGRIGHSAAWLSKGTGGVMMIWGGANTTGYLDSGYTFSESSLDFSAPLPTAPAARAHHSTVVNGKGGSKMILWGGEVGFGNGLTNTGAIFDASAPM